VSVRRLPRPTPAATPLQVWTQALFGVLDDAREELGEREWEVFVSLACDRIGVHAARLLLAELIRRERREDAA